MFIEIYNKYIIMTENKDYEVNVPFRTKWQCIVNENEQENHDEIDEVNKITLNK